MRSTLRSILLSLSLLCAFQTANAGEGPQLLLEAKRVVFLGDSITYGGEYLEFLETYIRIKHPEVKTDYLNLGLSSETVSGLSEPGHAGGQFPRPELRERLGRILEKVKPDLIVACYGMNDGIYYPLSEERLKKYQEGIIELREKAAAVGAKVIHITPPVFDPLPIKSRTLPAGLKEYPQPYEGYNQVLDEFSKWLVNQRSKGWVVIDIHQPMNQFLADKRQESPNFLLAGDGVHLNSQGQWLIAREVLKALGAPNSVVTSEKPEILSSLSPSAGEVLKRVQKRQRLRKDAWLNEVGHLRPGMPKGLPISEVEGL